MGSPRQVAIPVKTGIHTFSFKELLMSLKVSGAILLALLFFCPPPVSADTEKYPKPENVFKWTRAERLLGFMNMEKLTPAHEVKAGGTVRPLQPATSKRGQKMAALLKKPTEDFLKTGDIVGVIVVRKGEVLVEEYAHGFTAEDRWTSFSVAKSFASTLIGAALKDGSIKSLSDQVVQYVPELKGTAYDGVTILHLLAMTSGVKWDENYSADDSDVVRLALGLGGDKNHDQLKDLAKLAREAEPGQLFSYKTGETNLLGIILMRATGKSMAEYLSEKIWKPCGMEKSAWWAVDRQSRELAGCCLSMTLRDYARFGLFTLNGGQAGKEQMLPPDWMARATTDSTGNHYGYQWWVLDDDVFAANGIFGQLIAIDRRSQSVAVILSAWDGPLSSRGDKDRFQYLYKIRSIVMGGQGKQ